MNGQHESGFLLDMDDVTTQSIANALLAVAAHVRGEETEAAELLGCINQAEACILHSLGLHLTERLRRKRESH